jgi:DNA-directed RNA polymerase subunit RPC12/RpoP
MSVAELKYKGECAECCMEIFYTGEDPIKDEVITCPECGSDMLIIEVDRENYRLKFEKIQLSGPDWGE